MSSSSNHDHPLIPLSHLGDLSVTEFLSDYWQKKPVCIRNGVAFQEALIAVDELAGLALEPEVESRLIENKGDEIWFVGPHATVYEAIEIMAEKAVGALVVMEDEKLVSGLVTFQ